MRWLALMLLVGCAPDEGPMDSGEVDTFDEDAPRITILEPEEGAQLRLDEDGVLRTWVRVAVENLTIVDGAPLDDQHGQGRWQANPMGVYWSGGGSSLELEIRPSGIEPGPSFLTVNLVSNENHPLDRYYDPCYCEDRVDFEVLAYDGS